jgi:hypothetical protein
MKPRERWFAGCGILIVGVAAVIAGSFVFAVCCFLFGGNPDPFEGWGRDTVDMLDNGRYDVVHAGNVEMALSDRKTRETILWPVVEWEETKTQIFAIGTSLPKTARLCEIHSWKGNGPVCHYVVIDTQTHAHHEYRSLEAVPARCRSQMQSLCDRFQRQSE